MPGLQGPAYCLLPAACSSRCRSIYRWDHYTTHYTLNNTHYTFHTTHYTLDTKHYIISTTHYTRCIDGISAVVQVCHTSHTPRSTLYSLVYNIHSHTTVCHHDQAPYCHVYLRALCASNTASSALGRIHDNCSYALETPSASDTIQPLCFLTPSKI